MEVAINADRTMREALISAVLERAPRQAQGPTPQISNLAGLTRAKVAPMVNGLFPLTERSAILKTLAGSVIFLTPENIESTLRSSTWLGATWSLANMYLLQRGAEPLSPQAPAIVGLSEETTCYLRLDYFDDQEQHPFSDYLVHEAAHIFHNCKRGTVGLTETRSREFLLNINYAKRATFAYACEAYSRILVLADSPQSRRAALLEHSQRSLPADAGVDQQEYLDILAQAVGARNGWKRILKACAPPCPQAKTRHA